MNTKLHSIKDFQIYLVFLAILAICLFVYNKVLGTVALIGLAFLVYMAIQQVDRANKAYVEQIESLHKDFEKLSEHVIFNMPFPLVVTDAIGKILWYNTPFLKIHKEDSVMGLNLAQVVGELKNEDLEGLKDKDRLEVTMAGQDYLLFANVIEREKNGEMQRLHMFYFLDNTDYKQLLEVYKKERIIVGIIEIDNYDEVMDATPPSGKPLLVGQVDNIVNQYFHRQKALIRKVEDDTYLAIMTQENKEAFRESRFSILDEVRAIEEGNSIPMTLSIGVSREGLNLLEAFEEADTCLDVALGRGGDQAVVMTEDNYEYFGGKSKALEKRNKVKARVLGIALRQLMDKAEKVFIMGHTNPDMDAIGSSIGLMWAAQDRGKEAYVVLNKSNPSIDALLKRMREEEKDLYSRVISGEEAEDLVGSSDLLILVDNHKPSFTIHPPLLERMRNVVVIDHHRRGKEIVEDPVLTYIEPYASSTAELVTEMITYMTEELSLSPFEADALMSGIVVDTKNFTFRTGVRTFEAASILKRAGADMAKVRTLFEDDYHTIVARAEVVHKAKIVYNHIAISHLEEDADNSVLVSAQAADELLDINGVDASFVMTLKDDMVHISGRSYGEVSVQLILEKLGGGGHLNMAGAQLAHVSLDQAEEKLMAAIEEYINEGEKE